MDSRMARCPDPTPGPRSEVHRVRSGGPEGEEERRPWKMAFWEDCSVPHPTATSPESRNHAELVELIRGALAIFFFFRQFITKSSSRSGSATAGERAVFWPVC